MKKFNVFDELAFDTKQKLLSFCDYAPKTLSRYDSIVEMLKEVMDGTEMVFSLHAPKNGLTVSLYLTATAITLTKK
jgi:hypothetical protein